MSANIAFEAKLAAQPFDAYILSLLEQGTKFSGGHRAENTLELGSFCQILLAPRLLREKNLAEETHKPAIWPREYKNPELHSCSPLFETTESLKH